MRDSNTQWTQKFHHGDCLSLMGKMETESVGLIVTSPPYNLRNSTGNGMKDGRGSKWASAQLRHGYESHVDNMPYDEYVQWQRDCLSAMLRVLRNDGAVFYNHKDRVQGGLLQSPDEIVRGFPVRQRIIWHRSGGINFNRGYFLPNCETIYLLCKPAFKLAAKANAVGCVWRISQERNNSHPAPFPVELAKRCIASTTAEVVLDPFAGSGTVALAAEMCGRRWIGMDVSESYCEAAYARWRDYVKNYVPSSYAKIS